MKMFLSFILLGLVAAGLAQTVCRTPNDEEALCISVHRCPVLKKAYRNHSREAQLFLRESECGYDNSPWVCCGSVARFQSLESITATPPPIRITSRATPAPYKVQASTKDPKSHKNFGLLPMERRCGVQSAGEIIVGGNETQLNEFPWMALLEYERSILSNRSDCGGMLINNRYVLTAAHCVTEDIFSAIGKLISVRLGEHDTKKTKDCNMKTEGSEEFEECAEPHQDILVEEVIPHPQFNLNGEVFNDIALIRLAHPVVFQPNIRPICLPVNGETSKPGMELYVAGWGIIKDELYSNVKLKTKMPIVSQEECKKKYSLVRRRVSDQQFCAGGVSGIDSCRGDSGGPIMAPMLQVKPRRWYAAGIISYGPTLCGRPGWPGVYTKISSYMNWILDNIKP